MKGKHYTYELNFLRDNFGEKVLEIKQNQLPVGSRKSMEIFSEDIDYLIGLLQNAKLEINQKDYFDDTKDEVVNIDPRILDTMVTLHFSGVTINELEIQYNINSSIIKDNLERKGIILFDRF
ncbi:MAG TPA: hypothetical protein PLP39_07905 [Flavobacterium lutivivi]|nr:hypothetical protein [Flavobacterium lutivivi]